MTKKRDLSLLKSRHPIKDRLQKKVDDKRNIKRKNILKIKLTPEEETIKLENLKKMYYGVISDDTEVVKSAEVKKVMADYPPWLLYTDKLKPDSIIRVIGCDEIFSPNGRKSLGIGLRCISLKDINEIEDDCRQDLENIVPVMSWTAQQQLRVYHFRYPDAFLRALGFVFLFDGAEDILHESASNNGEVNLDAVFARWYANSAPDSVPDRAAE